MRLPALLVFALLFPAVAFAQRTQAVLLESASVPEATVTVGVSAGTDAQSSTSAFSMEAGIGWRLGDRFSLRGGVSWEQAEVFPSAAVRVQWLSEQTAPINLTSSVGVRARGMEDSGPALELRTTAGRSFGTWTTSASALVGWSVGERGDLDFEAGASAGARVFGPVRAGVEARVRGELVDEFKTDEDLGRPVELLVGPSVFVDLEQVRFGALAGYRSPRGLGPAGPAVFGSMSFDF